MPLVRQKFIVRRLTPLECCRLQGFPDGWGEIEHLDDMDKPTLAFWRQVYITHRKINELPVQASMLTSKARVVRWHNGLRTDAAEYKMWGNGMAKPNAQFVVRRACEYLRGMPGYPGAITLGSLFDGSGTMPLCIEEEPDGRAVWASEVEPYPIAVTRTHLPSMRHLGSVTDIDGAQIEPVDIITFGSPCQDLSIAGKRAGLKHEDAGDEETTRSGMFIEAVRIAREMYAATGGRFPKIMIWENVPGAFSSNGGEDFETVLNELLHIVHPNEFICRRGKWPTARDYGAVAYRTFDAQFWGVPQRRRRVYALVDLRGECAGEILFEPYGMPWDFTPGRAARQRTAPDAQRSPRTDSYGGGAAYTLKIRSGCDGGGKGALIQTDKSATLATGNDQTLFVPQTARTLTARNDGSPMVDRGPEIIVQTASFSAGQGAKARGIGYEEEKAPTLKACPSGLNQAPAIVQAARAAFTAHRHGEYGTGVGTLRSAGGDTGGGGETLIVEEAEQ